MRKLELRKRLYGQKTSQKSRFKTLNWVFRSRNRVFRWNRAKNQRFSDQFQNKVNKIKATTTHKHKYNKDWWFPYLLAFFRFLSSSKIASTSKFLICCLQIANKYSIGTFSRIRYETFEPLADIGTTPSSPLSVQCSIANDSSFHLSSSLVNPRYRANFLASSPRSCLSQIVNNVKKYFPPSNRP